MTPTQLRAYAAVVRLGSVKRAAAELGVSEAAVSLHIAQLRRQLGDPLFTRTASGLAFTPGGLRLAGRADEMLSLQERTKIEVSQAAKGRRLLRVGASSVFAEYAAPGLIELFASRAADLEVELSVHDPRRFADLLRSRTLDVAIGPRMPGLDDSLVRRPFLNYQVAIVAGPDHPLARVEASPSRLREQTWLLGPSAATTVGVIPALLQRIGVPESRQQIFQSHAAALEEVKRGNGIAPAVTFAVAKDLATGSLVRLSVPQLRCEGVWSTLTLATQCPPPAAEELVRFVTTPRATQAMLRGPGVGPGRFRPAVHVTLWSSSF
ncbi:LysR family transcriptional regulator [Thermopolyspora flexuosa]|jgi:DNA-binding transcriptional LysR family regulator|uniref:DNA-binding transcriptional LysR family regulator n=1 Tax=Thermopolyspora flexuosa TaxID=103836 RepID=A0A543IWH9_9ACTN|nr:LysR family transcriptional regulator [Thermopolyspora flexuosa]TQM74928.1 DNA-binding transcriptional LysR family regulator [Thermopolyspora flexuosa]GGM79975.1 LysR family transcriptional regulator [Thermopolyspora flexuosa]